MATSTLAKHDVLEECKDDHVGLWAVIGYVEDELTESREENIRAATLELLAELLSTGQVQAGFPDSNGRNFHTWPFSSQIIIDYIASRWKTNARPRPGEIVWFTAPSTLSMP
jgi:hypothetical protein